jgi:glutathione S-transferase
MTKPLKLYHHPLSGHCHRVQAFLSLLGVPYELVEIDILKGQQRQPSFREKNAFGEVPVIEQGDLTLADSSAILVYLALRYDNTGQWLPRAPLPAAHVQRWLSIASGELVRGPGDLRRHALLGGRIERDYAEPVAAKVLALMEDTLTRAPFLIGEQPTIADLALYAYTARAPEGGVDLSQYAAVRGWHARLEALPGFVPMPKVG